MKPSPAIHLIQHHPQFFAKRTGFPALREVLQATPVWYDPVWERLQARSWTLGHMLRRAGIAWYGTTWNSAVPLWDDLRFLFSIAHPDRAVAHFLWGEFALPKWPALYRRRGITLVGTFHSSARRQAEVLGRVPSFNGFDRISLVSRTQVPYFVERGYPEDQLEVILLGVECAHFRPGAYAPRPDGPLRALLVGFTERDHEFMAAVLRKLPPNSEPESVSEERHARIAACRAAINSLAMSDEDAAHQPTEWQAQQHEIEGRIAREYRNRIDLLDEEKSPDTAEAADMASPEVVQQRRLRYVAELELRLQCVKVERHTIYAERQNNKINDESLRSLVQELDLSEITLRKRLDVARRAAAKKAAKP